MRILLLWFTVLGVVPWVLRKTARGDFTVEQAAWILVGATVLAALPKKVMRGLTVFGGLVLLALEYSHGDPNTFWAIFEQLMALAIVLLGLTMIILAPFKSNKTRDAD